MSIPHQNHLNHIEQYHASNKTEADVGDAQSYLKAAAVYVQYPPNDQFEHFPGKLEVKIECSIHNRRRRLLSVKMDQFRRSVSIRRICPRI